MSGKRPVQRTLIHTSWRLGRGLSPVRASSPDPLVEKTPAPGLAWLEATDDRMAAVAEVPGRVPSRRGVAARHLAAAEANAQVNGTGAFADAVLAHFRTSGRFLERRGGQMVADSMWSVRRGDRFGLVQ